ncbi:MAG: hypothetical protein KA712_10040 [Myxococcales bacterium]|nr:hypothetical protein [Myxococcales bacterium]
MKKALGMMFVGLVGLGGWALASCGETEELINCQRVCARYESCFDDDYDVGACRSRCETQSDEEAGFEEKVNACESCIDDESCTSATFSCATTCAGIVP